LIYDVCHNIAKIERHSIDGATREVLEYIRPYVIGYKIDLKSMRDKNYRKLGMPLQVVLDSIKRVKEMGIWLEIVTLVIPGFNLSCGFSIASTWSSTRPKSSSGRVG
jgi:hypothetical protein